MQASKLIVILMLATAALAAAQDQVVEPACTTLFIKATFYPTFSLSRYDYDIDRNRQELRAYIELREKSIHGDVVRDASVRVNGTPIEFNAKEGDYRQRILIQKRDYFARDIRLEIDRPDGCRVHDSVRFPGWVRISTPLPEILPAGRDIPIRWAFSNNPFPLVLHVTDFKQRKRLLREPMDAEQSGALDAEKVPEDSILRIWITSDWFFKKYLRGRHVVRGSEINVMPWSQVFVRTKATQTDPK